MAKSRRGPGAGEVSFNMTPMIDCTFQLIIFFILTSQAASADLAKLVLSQPYDSPARTPKEYPLPYKVVVNITSLAGGTMDSDVPPDVAGKAKHYVIGGKKYSPMEIQEVENVLRERKNEHLAAGGKMEDFYVEIRADKRVHFIEVLPVMETATAMDISKMTLTALVELKEM